VVLLSHFQVLYNPLLASAQATYQIFGQIYPENIELCGAASSVTACLSLGEYTASLTIPLVLVP